MHMNKLMTWTGAFGLAATMALLTGCSSANHGVITSASFRHNPSPELYSLTQTKKQYMNDRAEVIDLNTRQIPDDINSLFFFDQPLHLSPYVMP